MYGSSCKVPVILVTNELEFSGHIFKKYSNFMRVCSVEAELLHAEKRTVGETDGHDEANSRLVQFFKRAKGWSIYLRHF
jgi:hypothetical protein